MGKGSHRDKRDFNGGFEKFSGRNKKKDRKNYDKEKPWKQDQKRNNKW